MAMPNSSVGRGSIDTTAPPMQETMDAAPGTAPPAATGDTNTTPATPTLPTLQRQDTTTTSTSTTRQRLRPNPRAPRRPHSPGIEWHAHWTPDRWKDGRVLLIDYVAREHTSENRRKIIAQEFWNIDGLHKFYANQDVSTQAALRVIHVQNAPWATRFLLRKFNIDASDDLVGTTFGRWARYENPKKRGQGKNAKPVPSGKTFRAQRDPWRGISRAAFGLDYLKHYEKHRVVQTVANQGMKLMELNHFDALDNPAHAFDAYAQRLSVYVQLAEETGVSVDPNVRNPYRDEEEDQEQRSKGQFGAAGDANANANANGHRKYMPKLESLDNGSTVILFEHSQSGSVNDTLIGARQEVEQRWRRLTFYLPREETSNDERLAIECMDFILGDIFRALSFAWEKYIHACENHVAILEDKIYENPADESRAPELWLNASLWLKLERLLYIHTNIVKEMQVHLRDCAHEDPGTDDPWLASTAEELDKLTMQFQKGVVSPTANLSDLMYKSVEIRDAHHSLRLGLSMWRLSWITFIFLPLTFVVGFFGMNVSVFADNPSIKWWFITTMPLFAVVVAMWYGVKHNLDSQRQHPLRRGVYESLFHELAETHPRLWTRRGPRDGIVPIGWWSAVKWRLITAWFDPDRTIAIKDYDPSNDEMGFWSRTKTWLAKRWLDSLPVLPLSLAASATEDSEALALTQDLGALGELLHLATPIAMADGDPAAASGVWHRVPIGRLRSLRSLGPAMVVPGYERMVSGDGVGGIMVEEKDEDEVGGHEHS